MDLLNQTVKHTYIHLGKNISSRFITYTDPYLKARLFAKKKNANM